uniref:Large ribosomal subunit protein uL23c n=1 Tax=Palmaria palmata TaxID=2822 RepID=A0A1C9CHG6_PALPL|nr:ribosomal protein L23 [Palmaria palmata]AOM67834.1 ribosomal protein L23 [Palmaria palmata]
MLHNQSNRLLDLVRKPLLTDKTTRMLEENQYSFAVIKSARKGEIKEAIEYIFDVKVIKVNTMNMPIKKRTVGKFAGTKPQYKKAIIKLASGDKINLFPED